MTRHVLAAVAVCSLGAGSDCQAQNQWLVNDRGADTIWRLSDVDGDGYLADPGEVFVYFNGANAQKTLAPQNPTSLARGPGRRVLMGDQGNRCVYLLQDLNGDGDAQDAGESIVYADQTNASGASFAFPTGVAFTATGRTYVSNAGNAFGADAIYRLTDLNGDGDANDAGEITTFVTFLGVDDPDWGPQEIETAPGLTPFALYFRNSIADNHGVFMQFNGPVAAREIFHFPFFNVSNGSGLPVGPGFCLERNRDRALSPPFDSFYTIQTQAGGVDQIVRMVQITLDGDANDPNEARLVYENSAAGFTAIDLVSMPNGDVYLTDAGAPAIYLLRDYTRDGDFMDDEETEVIYDNGAGTMADIRQMVIYRLECPADFDGDEFVGASDLAFLLGSWGQDGPADLTGNGVVTASDLARLLGSWGLCTPL